MLGQSLDVFEELSRLMQRGADTWLLLLTGTTRDMPSGILAADAFQRSPQWPKVRKAWLADHPACAACGCLKGVVPHHVRPFHLFPEFELDPTNLISLCETTTWNCHLRIGHGGNFKNYVPDVRRIAKVAMKLATMIYGPGGKP